MSNADYDYIIVGAGAAGLQLALALQKDSHFQNLNILIIEKYKKEENDKTWSFWEKGSGQWDELIFASWSTSLFYGPNGKQLTFDLSPYSYKSLRSIDFYEYAKATINNAKNIDWITEEVIDVKKDEGDLKVKIITTQNLYHCTHCFDSRLAENWSTKESQKHTTLWQHFKGWIIDCEADVFDSEIFTMMDFRLRHQDTTSFIYILPLSNKKALVEFTLFTTEIFQEDNAYDTYLQKYILDFITTEKYEISETEQGVIPMTNYPFHKNTTPHITKIGTAGSWVRPSTGYSFYYIGKYVSKLIDNLKNGNRPDKDLLSRKVMWLDSVFLEVLHHENQLGPSIFEAQYSKNSIQQIFKFLDGETSFAEDLKMTSSFDKMPFLKGAWRHFWKKLH